MVRANSFSAALFLLFTASPCSLQQWFPNDTIPSREVFAEHAIAAKLSAHAQSIQDLDCNSVQFYLATRKHPNGNLKACNEQKAQIFNGYLNVTKSTKILVHGWKNSRETSFTRMLTKSYLEAEDVNVIQVDWSAVAKTDYFTAAYRVPQVGKTLADFVKQMVSKLKLDVSNLDLVGFSLGAHVVGIAGYLLTPKVARVIGLDPAGPLFEFDGPAGRLSKESGKFVMTLHTCKYRLGTFHDLGHLNFNANSGMSQPGCWETEDHDILGFCSHGRAPRLLSASLLHPKGFLAVKCNCYIELEFGMCKYQATTYFTANADKNAGTGIYFFETSSSYPYLPDVTSDSLLWTNQTRVGNDRMKNFSRDIHLITKPKSGDGIIRMRNVLFTYEEPSKPKHFIVQSNESSYRAMPHQ